MKAVSCNTQHTHTHTQSPHLILRHLTQHQEGGLVALGAALEDVDQVSVGVVLNILSVHLQQHVPLGQLGTARVVHDQLHNRTQVRLTYRYVGRVRSHDKSHDTQMKFKPVLLATQI